MSVDVLAVLRAARDSVPAEQLLDYCAAVAAVAELAAEIEALRAARDASAEPAINGYTCTVPDDCETLHWRGQILSMNELASMAQPAASAEPAVWVAADTLNSPHPTCISSLAYMSQLDRERGREYVPLYAVLRAGRQ